MNDVQETGTFVLRVNRIIAETAESKSFVLEPVNGKPVSYMPGQFLTFLFEKANGTEDRRNYSISSVPGDDLSLTITVKRVPNGEYSRKLIDRVKPGDELLTIGASGFFTLPPNVDAYEQFVFFAAGSGISPVFALIKTLLSNHPSVSVVLIYSNSSIEQAIFYNDLQELHKKYPPRFQVEFLFSNANRIEHKRLGIHLLEKFLVKYVHGSLDKQLFYLCGPFEYMRMITIVLKNNGVQASHIRKEIFTIEVPLNKPQPRDKALHHITAELNETRYRFNAQYPQTILQSAKSLQIPLPYSCEAGQCGTCAATCISGKVWMWRNDVLLDEEIAKGRVLTCTGYAVDGDVVLKY